MFNIQEEKSLEGKSFFHSHEKSDTWYKHITPVYGEAVPAPIYSVLYLCLEGKGLELAANNMQNPFVYLLIYCEQFRKIYPVS